MTLEELKRIKEKNIAKILLRKKITADATREIFICSNTGCQSTGCRSVFSVFENKIKEHGLKDVKVTYGGCLGPCGLGPNMIIYPEEVFYNKVDAKGAELIFDNHILKGEPVVDYLFDKNEANKNFANIGFFKKQYYIAKANFQKLNPESIEEYIAVDGFTALHKALTSMTPEQVIAEIKESGLRGRGGAGFPTGMKWELTRASKAKQKYVVCNADEGDPGAYMDRTIIEAIPFKIIEAMTIAAYVIGADKGYVYLRAEYPLAGERLEKGIKLAHKYGLLGKNIFGTGYNFDLRIKYGAGAFVCGEETALMHSIEGKRGEPRARPPFPAEKGVFDSPTLLNNVETYANVPEIILHGGKDFANIGFEKSKGTKVFSLTGNIVNSGLIELPMGTTLRDIIFEIGGGIPNGKEFKAVQVGGPSGGCIPKSMLDTPVTYEGMIAAGAMMGSGGMIVLDEDTNMVEMTKFFLEFTCDESCGKCTPCRVGNKRLLELLNKIIAGKGEMADLDELESLSLYIKQNSLCGLGQTSPNPVLSTLKHFKQEYIDMIEGKKKKYKIAEDKCKGCTICARQCPVKCISMREDRKHIIDATTCIGCGACEAACKFGAISRS